MSGNFNLTYNDSIPPITIGGTLVQEEEFVPGETKHFPAEYNLDAFEQPDSGDRMWQEVTDLN